MKISPIAVDHLLAAAARAKKKSTPLDCGFFVGAAAEVISQATGRGRIVAGYNKDTKFGRALHAEEGLISRLRPDELIRRLVCLGGGEQQEVVVTPCGGCRAALVTYAEPDAAVLLPSAPPENWFPIHQLLPQPRTALTYHSQQNVERNDLELFESAVELLKNKPLRFITRKAGLPPLPAAASMLTKGEMFTASAIDNAAFWPGHPEVIVVGMADAARERKINTLVLVHQGIETGEFAYPCGPCLQFVYEYSQVAGNNPRVVLANRRAEFMAMPLQSLLSHPFGPQDLGIDLSQFR